jgi:hypothetical protein
MPSPAARGPEKDKTAGRARFQIHASETIGLLLIAVLLLVITLIRYWHQINWSAR